MPGNINMPLGRHARPSALQEAGIFGTRPVPFFEFDWLGIHADAYSLSAQLIALLAIAVLYGRSWLAEKRRVAIV